MNRTEVECWVVGPGDALDLTSLGLEERRRAAAMHSQEAVRRYTRGRAALRQVLAGYLGIAPREVALAPERGSAPRILGCSSLHVGLAHTGPYVAVAVGERRLGLDLDVVGGHRRVPPAACAPEKLGVVRSLVEERAAADTAWVVQEAALKADGVGLGFPFRDVMVAAVGGGFRVELTGRSSWGVTIFAPGDGLIGAVAADGPPPRVHVRRSLPVPATFASGLRIRSDGRWDRTIGTR